MEQTGEYRIGAPRDVVWRALNDPQVLAECIDGCLSMDQLDDNRYQAKVKARIGPVSATFDATLELCDRVEPESYRLVGNVKGGAAGFAKGEAQVKLEDEQDVTVLRYQVSGNVGGKLAQIGSRLVDAATRKIADDFFAAFGENVAPGAVEQLGAAEGSGYETSGRWVIWIIMFAVLLLAFLFSV